jgi:two-component system, cell cycle sensor histidine kinase and response regulator CckA
MESENFARYDDPKWVHQLASQYSDILKQMEDIHAEKQDADMLLQIVSEHASLVEDELTVTTEQALATRNQYEFLVNVSQDLMVLTDKQFCVRAANDSFCALLQKSRASVLGSQLNFMLPEVTDMAAKEAFDVAQVCNLKDYLGGELEIQLEGKPARWFECRVYPYVSGTQGAIEYMVFILRDIQERKRAQAEKEQLEQQIQQTQKLEAIGRLAGGVAHDFNNILQSVLNSSQLIRLKLEKSLPVSDQLQGIELALEKGRLLITNLLTYSRERKTTQAIIDLREVVEDSAFLSSLHSENITVKWELEDIPIWIRGNSTEIQQVVINLINNAAQSMEPKGGELIVRLHKQELTKEKICFASTMQAGNYALLEVIDQGCGIALEHRVKIFEPFFTTKETGRGHGVGLSYVFGILQEVKAGIEVSSVVGKGTTFCIYFPIQKIGTGV